MSYLIDAETFKLMREIHLKKLKDSLIDYEEFLMSYGTMPSMKLVETGLKLIETEGKKR